MRGEKERRGLRPWIQQILTVLYEEHCKLNQKPRPVTLYDIQECRFFQYWNNAFKGWFVTVAYATRPHERWFVVMLDDGWHLERVD
jgi:hypothetical protein